MEKALGMLVVSGLSRSQQRWPQLPELFEQEHRSKKVAIIPLLLIRSHTVPSFRHPNARQTLTARSKSAEGYQDGQGL